MTQPFETTNPVRFTKHHRFTNFPPTFLINLTLGDHEIFKFSIFLRFPSPSPQPNSEVISRRPRGKQKFKKTVQITNRSERRGSYLPQLDEGDDQDQSANQENRVERENETTKARSAHKYIAGKVPSLMTKVRNAVGPEVR